MQTLAEHACLSVSSSRCSHSSAGMLRFWGSTFWVRFGDIALIQWVLLPLNSSQMHEKRHKGKRLESFIHSSTHVLAKIWRRCQVNPLESTQMTHNLSRSKRTNEAIQVGLNSFLV